MEIDVKTTHVVEIETGIPMSNNNTDNYNSLTNKPQINGITLSGNKTTGELGINIPTKISELENDKDFIDKTYHDSTKVDKEENKGLSTNDYTNEDKNKVDNSVDMDKFNALSEKVEKISSIEIVRCV